MEKLHPGTRWHFRLKVYSRFTFLIFFFMIFVSQFIFALSGIKDGGIIIAFILIMLVFAVIVVLIIGEIYARMAYNRWFYEFTDTSLKLERGIIWKKYSNIPYERVQNIDIRRGIIARLFGFSEVDIQTAGYSAMPQYGRRRGLWQQQSEGYIPGVDVGRAEQIRDFVMKKLKNN
jgi:membrane protein YdbS with pleckstrin-like domain